MPSSIKSLITKKGLSVKAFAKQAGIPYTTLLAMIQTGIDKSSVGNVIKVARALGVDLEDLSSDSADDDLTTLPASQYPAVPAGVAAGALEEIDCMSELPHVSIPDMLMGRWAGNKKILLMHVNGASMDRIIPDKSAIAVLTGVEKEQLKNGDIIVATDGNRTYTVKRFFDDAENQRIILRPESENPSFLPIVIGYDSAEDFRIVGKVVIYSVFLS